MIFIYDIVLNLTDNYYYDFYEWDKKDNIINIKKIPIIYVNTNTLKDFINYKIKVDKNFLKLIKDKCLIYKKNNINYKYLILLSNKKKTIGVSFQENGTVIYKSSMLFDEEEEANRLINKVDMTEINYKILDLSDNNLTLRKDYLKRKIMLKKIKKIFNNQDYDKLKYIYFDLFYEDISSYNEMYNKIICYLKESICNFDELIYLF